MDSILAGLLGSLTGILDPLIRQIVDEQLAAAGFGDSVALIRQTVDEQLAAAGFVAPDGDSVADGSQEEIENQIVHDDNNDFDVDDEDNDFDVNPLQYT
ncbi:uncharacterized protein Triagg1_7574 [Trichoderma aggressivum f. europaeum]|uniref:Uncharacterized protein n=1 Tax=Trichoderma aggressivum f. europaeum TaxID=173218 RepID=A0AAE1IDA8_9HYPO|nr:hypothetical protein Triagg1_7574 [Trichoderma aggressivum f. europaeum]